MRNFVALIGGLVAVLLLAGQLARAASAPAVPNDGFPAMSGNGVDVGFWRDSPSLGPRVMEGAAAGTSIHAVTSGYVPSSDGSGEHGVATGITDPSIDVTGAAWSPDGTRLAYASGADLYVVRADGTGATRVYAGGGAQTGNPSWSADGTTIAFETNAG